MERKLAAILAADLVGFSRMMGRDEEGTLARLKQVRREVLEPALGKFGGRIFKTTGDGFLIEFGSVIDAYRVAAQFQQELHAANKAGFNTEPMVFRIGINVGDVICDDGDVYGDGVNIAARLEPICPPGGICVSERAWRDLRQLDIAFVDIGDQRMKNIGEAVRAFAVMPSGEIADAAGRRRPYEATVAKGGDRRKFLGIGLLAIALLLLAAATARHLLGGPAGSLARLSIMEVRAAPSEHILARTTRAALLDFMGSNNGILLVRDGSGPRSRNNFTLQGDLTRTESLLRFTFTLANADSRSPLLTYILDRPVAEQAVAGEQAAILVKRVVGCLLSGVNTHPSTLPDRVLMLYGQICKDSYDDTLGFGGIYDHARSITSLSPEFSLGWSARAFYAAKLSREQTGSARQSLIDDARQAATTAESLNPHNSEVFLAREQLLPASALIERERLLRRATQAQLTYDGYEYLFYGRLLTELGRDKEAVVALQRAYDQHPLVPMIGRVLADSLVRTDRKKAASTLLQRLRRVWPNDPSLSNDAGA